MKNNLLHALLMFSKYSFIGVFFQCLFLTVLLAAETNAQKNLSVKEVNINLNLSSATIEEVFSLIESKTQFRFSYDHKDVDEKTVVNFNNRRNTVADVLIEVSKRAQLKFKQVNNNINVTKIVDRRDLKNIEQIEVIIQTRNVSGKVTSMENNESLPGVNIIEKGTSNGTVSDIDGNFNLEVAEDATLVFSSVGFVSEEVAIGGRSVIDITLAPDITSLEEIVVIGYGSVTKRELTGSVSSVKEEDFNQGAVTDAMELIQGKVAGLSITRTNGGDPTQGLQIRLRGSSSLSASEEPLIVIDGIPGGDLNAINPENIESIDILKDGSAAAIYGTRGTNGVILVTTKQGEPGNMQVEYSGRVSTQTPSRRIEVLSADEYREMKNRLSSTHPDIAGGMIDHGASTNWFDEITRTPFSHLHSLSLSGGAGNTTYRASLYYADQEGLFLNSAAEEYRANLNMQQTALNDRLEFNLQVGLSDRMQNPVNYDAMRQAIKRNPTEPVRNPDGSLFELLGAWQYENPVGMLIEREDDEGNTRFYGNLGATLSLTNSLSISALAGVQSNKWLHGYYEPSYSYPQEVQGKTGFASRRSGRDDTRTFESTIQWSPNTDSHGINIIGGYSFQEFNFEEFEAENSDFITDGFGYNNLGSGTYLEQGLAGMESLKEKSRLVGYFGRATYNFKHRYFLSASVRYEGSSKFGANNKWGMFPAVSAAWDLSNEGFGGFMDNFNLLKLRVGYGVTGNADIDPYISLQRLNQGGFFFYEGEFIPGYEPVSNPNPNLKWETKNEFNVGLDWSLSGGRFGGAVDYYIRDTRDLLHSYDVPVPPNLYTETFANVGSMRNSGIELSFNTIPIQSGNLTWTIDFNVDYRKNKLLSLSNEQYKLEYRNVGGIGSPGIEAWSHRYEPGRSIGSFHAYRFEGLDEDGGWIFFDPNDDGEITPDDRVYVGNGIPDFYAGFTSGLRYKNWDLTVLMRGMFGHQIINHKRIWYDNPKFLPSNILKSAMDSELWDDPQYSSYQIENGDFIKLDNVTIGYNLPLQNAGIRSSRIFFTCNNLALITGYSGLDPEVSIGGLEPGLDDRQDYPSARTYTLGINFSL